MIHRTKKTGNYNVNGNNLSVIEQLRLISASKLQVYVEQYAGKGSKYISIGDFKIRLANHINTSKNYKAPDLNIVVRNLNEEDLVFIKQKTILNFLTCNMSYQCAIFAQIITIKWK